ncbi:kinesin-domain-containing protein [Schizopora paradoxa]|uniref:Kinesin-domain-containing protein n=1 Tax=Schizopora paradoxa TaxID=27342 RepID=A0A0H2RW91_9AGAM|nr:kinesin-domain-containing protein [Schizopora paradoxa]
MVSAGSITVAVRVRPPNSWEEQRLPEPVVDSGYRGDGALSTPGRSISNSGCLREVVKIIDDRILMFDPDEKDRAKAFMERGFVPPGTRRYKDKRFMFDRVFEGSATQVDVYGATARPLLDGLLEGYNATVFAYGATGCGKTHTISGTDADPGLIYLTMSDLFQKIDDRRADENIDIFVTFLEIYNEEIRDLLAEPGSAAPRGGLQIREDKTVKVVGLVELHPTSAEHIKEIVLLGNTRRTQSPTHANETSSRSHAVLQVHVAKSPRTASTTEERSMATLSIIDLAGSERAAATTNMGQRMVEGANINKSLLALGNCINALCESGGATRHVPYRNSKLTRLLKFSLGGNCKTVMIVCIAPASNHFDDTHNTLLYADRASKIKTKVVTRNVVNVDRHVGQYVEAINRLNLEVAELKQRLAGKLNTEADKTRRQRNEAKAEVDRTKADMQRKAEQSKSSISAGATCDGRIDSIQARLQAYNLRLTQIKANGALTPDLVAEQNLLSSLVKRDEALLSPTSELRSARARASNADSMFDAMLHAVSERRSDRLEDIHAEHIKLEGQRQKAEMEKAKSEAKNDALRQAVAAQAQLVTNLLGILTRCTVMMEDGSKTLSDASGDGAEPNAALETMRSVSSSLHRLVQSNDESIKSLTGEEVASSSFAEGSSLLSFTGHTHAISSTIHHNSPARRNSFGNKTRLSSRRISSLNSHATSPVKQSHRSPRKSVRTSLNPAGARLAAARRVVSDKPVEKKKGVQWKDEAGRGTLDDGGLSPMTVDELSLTKRPVSRAGSESEWEDEATDASTSYSFTLPPPKDPLPSRSGIRKPRSSRLDPSFLKQRIGSTLGSLAEDDESKIMEPRRPSPFADRGNQLPSPHESDASGSVGVLKVPKGRARDESPERRAPTTMRVPGSAVKSGRRRVSNVGPVRSDKVRRRSSLLPKPIIVIGGTHDRENENVKSSGARRVPISLTPAKRVKRSSLLGARPPSSLGTSFLRPPVMLSTTSSISSDPANISGDMSYRGSKPTWR